jgi:hypothetical protein
MRPSVVLAAILLSNVLLVSAKGQAVPLAPKPPPSPKSLGLPEAPSPLLGFFQGYDAKEKKMKLAFIDSMPGEVVEKKVKKNGKDEIEFEQTFTPIVMANGVPIADVTFYNVQGQKLKTDSVLAVLKPGDTIVVSGDEKPIPVAYLKIFKPDAIIATLPLDVFIEPLDDLFPPPPGLPGAPLPAPPPPPAPPALPPRTK